MNVKINNWFSKIHGFGKVLFWLCWFLISMNILSFLVGLGNSVKEIVDFPKNSFLLILLPSEIIFVMITLADCYFYKKLNVNIRSKLSLIIQIIFIVSHLSIVQLGADNIFNTLFKFNGVFNAKLMYFLVLLNFVAALYICIRNYIKQISYAL